MKKLTQNFIPVKRQSKAAVFARYGIQYKNGKILAPEFGWIPLLAVKGNKKIGKVYHFSMLPTCATFEIEINGTIYTIPGTCAGTCKDCYATKGNYCFKSVRRALAIRTYLARRHLDFVRRALAAQIEAEKIELFRIHASGDFFSAEYIAMWCDTVKNYPGTTFWTYTKNKEAGNAFQAFPNANIVRSILPCGGFNFGKAGYILNAYEELKAAGETPYICKCGIDKNQHCENCKGCAMNKYVLFLLHGDTSYNPEKDPDFPRFVAVVKAQKEA